MACSAVRMQGALQLPHICVHCHSLNALFPAGLPAANCVAFVVDSEDVGSVRLP